MQFGNNLKKILFGITSCENRQEAENRLVLSILNKYPKANILISRKSDNLSIKRNKLVECLKEDFLLLLEEDFIFSDKTNIEIFLNILEKDKKLGVIGGVVRENGIPIYFNHLLVKKDNILYHKKDSDKWIGKDKERYKYTDSVLNFALFRKEVFNDILWDKNLKLAEHTDFFLRLKQTKWKVGFTDKVEIDTKKDFNDREYKEMKFKNQMEYLKKMMDKHNLEKIIYLNGFTWHKKGDKILKGRNI